ncbi:MAG: branched-chain amino acid ABC transporter substrate-binding protein [Anaerolineae bacterium]|nr:branched-chain amino acid ABC transporter substrate-binding protein [Anaerolineae bacterium]
MKQTTLTRVTLTIKLLLAANTLLAVTFLLSACAGEGFGTPSTLKIGLVAPFEGLYRPLGYEALFAVKLALQERNAQGGVNGYRLELVALNDFDDPAEARTQARALLADPDVLGVVGHLSAETSLAAMPVYQAGGLAMSVPWTLAAANIRRDGVVTVAANEAETAARLDTMSQKRGYNNIARVSSSTDIQVGTIPVDAQALELTAEGVAASEMILVLREAGLLLPLLGQVDVGSSQLVQVANGAARGLIYVSPGPDPQDVPGAENFVKNYEALAGFAPGPRAVLAYDATNVLLDAIEQVMVTSLAKPGGQPSRAEVSAIINQIQRRGLSGKIAFDAKGQRIDAPVWIYQISEEEQYPGELLFP